MWRLVSPLTTTRWRLPWDRVISMTSPIRRSRCGLAEWPLTPTLPPLHARCASDRVLNRHETSSQTSSLSVGTTQTVYLRYLGASGASGGQRAKGRARKRERKEAEQWSGWRASHSVLHLRSCSCFPYLCPEF